MIHYLNLRKINPEGKMYGPVTMLHAVGNIEDITAHVNKQGYAVTGSVPFLFKG